MNGKESGMKYVDGYVLPVPKKNLKAYTRMAQKAIRAFRAWAIQTICLSM